MGSRNFSRFDGENISRRNLHANEIDGLPTFERGNGSLCRRHGARARRIAHAHGFSVDDGRSHRPTTSYKRAFKIEAATLDPPLVPMVRM